MSRHEHSTKLLAYTKELRGWVGAGPPTVGAHGHRPLQMIIADALSAVDDELAAIDAAARHAAMRRHTAPEDRP